MNNLTDIFNFLDISPLLTTSGQPTEAQISALADTGYDVIINLALHDDPSYSLPDETKLVGSLGMKYIHIPVQFDAPSKNDLDAFFKAMDSSKNCKLHIHCAANMRVTAFLGLYSVIRQGQSKEAAFEPMQSIWEPDDVWAAFITSTLEQHKKYKGY